MLVSSVILIACSRRKTGREILDELAALPGCVGVWVCGLSACPATRHLRFRLQLQLRPPRATATATAATAAPLAATAARAVGCGTSRPGCARSGVSSSPASQRGTVLCRCTAGPVRLKFGGSHYLQGSSSLIQSCLGMAWACPWDGMHPCRVTRLARSRVAASQLRGIAGPALQGGRCTPCSLSGSGLLASACWRLPCCVWCVCV